MPQEAEQRCQAPISAHTAWLADNSWSSKLLEYLAKSCIPQTLNSQPWTSSELRPVYQHWAFTSSKAPRVGGEGVCGSYETTETDKDGREPQNPLDLISSALGAAAPVHRTAAVLPSQQEIPHGDW